MDTEQPTCISCGTTENLTFAPEPFPFHGDETDVWECDDCRRESCEDIWTTPGSA